MTITATSLKEAIELYHELVRQEGYDGPALEAFKAKMAAAKITYANRLACPYLRPQFVTPEEYRQISRVIGVLDSALRKVLAAFKERPELREMLALSDGEKKLLEPDQGYERVSPTCRFDSFLTETSWKFVELNAECPAGIAYNDVLTRVFLDELPTMKKFQERYRLTPFNARPLLLKVLLDAYREWGGSGSPLIAIVDWQGVSTTTEFHLFQEFFGEQGLKCLIVDPRELEYRNGRLQHEGIAIDLVYRRVITTEYLAKFDEVRPLFEAYRDRAVCVVNSFHSKLLHKKMIFGVLTDDTLQPYFSLEEQETIRAHIPWTRLLRDGYATRNGRKLDLLELAVAERENLVLKPNDEYGGRGITVGWECSPADWEKALKAALEVPYVLQERVPSPRVPFPFLGENGLEFPEQMIDLDPFVYQGQVGGLLTRLSGTALCNVTAGGGMVPTVLLEKP